MSNITTKEIVNQFTTWLKVDQVIEDNQELINNIKAYCDEQTTVIFTGAGTSGYIGDLLVPYLNKGKTNNRFISCYSTDIVGNPKLYLENKKVLLVSFARSGNSPESCEAVRLADMYAKENKNLIITCNIDGNLAIGYPNSTIMLPSETNDKGFAMTNSYSTMLITAAKIFGLEIELDKLVYEAKRIYVNFPYEKFKNVEFDNVVYLANSENVGLLNELKLKFMELTNGRFGYYSDQFLNFRHGPKSVITKKSLVIILTSGDEIGNEYELDLINELVNDENEPYVICFGMIDTKADVNILINLHGIMRALTILPTCQNLAVKKSEALGINPDNPSPSGSVNRVVQGVTIHERKIC